MKKVLVIGGTGTIGQAIVKELSRDTDLIVAGHSRGDVQVDLSSEQSIKTLFEKTGELDAVICAAARGVVFKTVEDMTVQDYHNSMQQKLLGQIAVTLESLKVLKPGGSVTLTTGLMNYDFVQNGSAAAMTNNAVEGFVQSAALDLPRNIRINVISPALLKDSAEKYADLCPGFEPVSSDKVARAYRKSVYGVQTGRVYHVS